MRHEIELGNAMDGIGYLAERARETVISTRQAAVFLCKKTGRCFAVAEHSKLFSMWCNRFSDQLIGTYQDKVLDGDAADEKLLSCMFSSMVSDMAEQLRDSPWWIASLLADKDIHGR